MITPRNATRRWIGLAALACAWALLNWGALVFRPFSSGTLSLGYWVVCIGLAAGAVALAVWEIVTAALWLRSALARRERRLADWGKPKPNSVPFTTAHEEIGTTGEAGGSRTN